MKKILYFINEDESFITHRFDLAKTAQENKLDVFVACRLSTHKNKIEEAHFRLTELKRYRRGTINPLSVLASIFEIVQIIKKIRPDIVHAVTLKMVLLCGIARFIAPFNRAIYAIAGFGFLFESQHLKAKLLRPVIHLFLSLFLSKKNTTTIVQNCDDFNDLKNACNIDEKKIILIEGAGVNTSLFTPSENKKSKQPFVVSVVARMLYDKGIREAVEAARLLTTKKLPIHIQLIGDPDPENPKSILKEQLKSWHQEGIITWLGKQKNVAEVYQQSHVALLPSYREGTPKSLLEAMACGLPIITTDATGCRDLIKSPANGILVPTKDAHAIAQAITLLYNDDTLRDNMGAMSLAFAKTIYDQTIINKKTVDLYFANAEV